MIILTQGQTAPSITDVITTGGVPVDLTGCTVLFATRPSLGVTVTTRAATVTNATGGAVRYDPVTGDTATPGEFDGWWRVTYPGGAVQDTPVFVIRVEGTGPRTLCTVGEVKMDPTLTAAGRTLDDEIHQVILAVTTDITMDTGREFITNGVNPQTRVIPVGGYAWTGVIPVGDMTSPPTGVAITTDYGVTSTTVPITTVAALPTNRPPTNPVTSLFVPGVTTGCHLVVTGSWGWPEIPEDIRAAAIATTRFRLRQTRALTEPSPDQFEGSRSSWRDGSDGPQLLYPASAMQVIRRYRTPSVA